MLDLLHKIAVEDNVSFFDKRGKSDVILDVVWAKDFDHGFVKHLSGMGKVEKLPGADDGNDDEARDITLMDCFEEFRKPEMLDDNNKWYCNKCKEHVRATKQMEIYKAPPIMIVSLKRFKQSSGEGMSRLMGLYSSSAGTQKIGDFVDFPLEDLDMSSVVKSET